MKYILSLLLLSLTAFSCKAQNPIIALFNGNEYAKTENAYYKDIDNAFNRFVGTWKYENGNQELTILLKKQQQFMFTFDNKTFYEDMMYGEYKYKDESGNTLVNTLSNIDTPITNMSEHLFW